MMPDYPLGETIDFKFTTRAFATGIPTTLAGTPAVEIYEDNDIAQITAAETLTADFDGITGLNNLRIVATSGNGFESGKSYAAIISTGTVGGVSVVGEVVAQFSIERSPALRPTTAGRTLDVTATGAAGIDWGNVENKTTANDLSATDIQLCDTVTTNSDMRGTDNAALASVLGALADAAAAGDPTSADTLMQYAKQLVNVLVGTAGVGTWPAAKVPGNANNFAEVLRGVVEHGGYSEGAVWIDEINGAAGTTDYENGTELNPVSTLADAITIAASVGLTRFRVMPGSTIAFGAESHANEVWSGENWSLDLGSVTNAAGLHVQGATLNGVMAGTGTTQIFRDCLVNAISILAGSHFITCGIAGTQTIIEAGDVFYDRCHSAVAGSGAPQYDMGAAIANSNLNIRHNSGGVDLRNCGASGTDNVSIEGYGQLVVNANCTGGTIELRGNWKLTDNGTATINTDDDTTDINAILVDTADMQPKLGTPAADVSADIAAVKVDTAATLLDTNELQGDWTDGGRLDLILDAIVADTNELQTDDVPGLIAALNDLSAAQVNAEVVDVLTVDTVAQPGQETPAATQTFAKMVAYLYKAWRNRKAATASQYSLYNDDAVTVDQKATLADDATTASQTEVTTGP
jgi:hypothetical protein